MTTMTKIKGNYVSTTNACKLCTPMGAALAIRGIEGAVPFLHGSQGCATYMRRYIISHFNEPIDIASSSLGEKNAVFGGGPNLKLGLKNVIEKYRPALIGIATTCLTETIGDDVAMILGEFSAETRTNAMPEMIHVSTPSYSGTHMDGFHEVCLAAVKAMAKAGAPPHDRINLLPGFLSPEDIRHLKEVIAAFGKDAVILPDISETLDGPALDTYPLIPGGGTPLEGIGKMASAPATLEFGSVIDRSAGTYLRDRFGVPLYRCGLPIGLRETDAMLSSLCEIYGTKPPQALISQRGRLLDAMVDGHKYISGKTAVVYGEEDLVTGMASFLSEIGIRPVLCVSGGKSGRLKEAVTRATSEITDQPPMVKEDADFHEIASLAQELEPDLLVGHSKGYAMARENNIPLIRVGFPIHDRMGGQRILHIGYQGALLLFDRIVNSVIARQQDLSPVGYSYM